MFSLKPDNVLQVAESVIDSCHTAPASPPASALETSGSSRLACKFPFAVNSLKHSLTVILHLGNTVIVGSSIKHDFVYGTLP